MALQGIGLLDVSHRFISGLDESTAIGYDSMVSHFPSWKSAYPIGTDANISMHSNGTPSVEIMYTGLRMTIDYIVDVAPVGVEDATFISTHLNVVLLGDIYWRDYHGTNIPIDHDIPYLSIEASYVLSRDINGICDADWVADVIKSFLIPSLNSMFYGERFAAYEGIYYLTNPQVKYNGDYVLLSADAPWY
eukprot:gnl/Chilomastix_caulleri/1496.p1 GENE.gnl/Chilomastix_caulleri/1496~~gnl/Chilomastix_caulleri/1496.p1  ORF type:complete len:191 (+),score=54.34 gnl/Chilomastix_caulleri/1496:336-908(+)